jgi:hypothetical protein
MFLAMIQGNILTGDHGLSLKYQGYTRVLRTELDSKMLSRHHKGTIHIFATPRLEESTAMGFHHCCHGHCHKLGSPRNPLSIQYPSNGWATPKRPFSIATEQSTGHPLPFGKHSAESTTALCPSRDAMGSDRCKFQILGLGWVPWVRPLEIMIS